jgi:LPS sulfotransferase NodH
VYSVFKQLGNGEFVHVASRDELEQAVQLVEALSTHWPGEYVVRDSKGNDVDLTE